MAAREELLKAEIDKTKSDLAEHLSQLRVEAQAAQKRTMARAGVVLGIVVLSLVAYRLLRFLRRRQAD
jgi:hypothetical protein